MMEVLGRGRGAVKQSGLEHCPNDRLCRTANGQQGQPATWMMWRGKKRVSSSLGWIFIQ